jgi:hypothetical protein
VKSGAEKFLPFLLLLSSEPFGPQGREKCTTPVTWTWSARNRNEQTVKSEQSTVQMPVTTVTIQITTTPV